MATLQDVVAGDKVTIEFEVATCTAGVAVLKQGSTNTSVTMPRSTAVVNITKAPKFKVGDRVRMEATTVAGSYYHRTTVMKYGTIVHISGLKAWVSWEKNNKQAPHESLVQLKNLTKVVS